MYRRHEDYALQHIVRDMIDCSTRWGATKPSGSVTTGAARLSGRWPAITPSAASAWRTCAYRISRRASRPRSCCPLIDRSVYPEAEYPAGQWDYQLFYEESFDKASAAFEANVANTVKALFRKGNPRGKGKASRTAVVRREGGWFGGAGQAPDLPMDTDLLTQNDFETYVAALQSNGFFGPDSWYMNRERNLDFASRAKNAGLLTMPVLFLHGKYDYTCETVTSRLAEPMRQDVKNLTEVTVASGHWMAQEKPAVVNAALAKWLAVQFPELWLA